MKDSIQSNSASSAEAGGVNDSPVILLGTDGHGCTIAIGLYPTVEDAQSAVWKGDLPVAAYWSVFTPPMGTTTFAWRTSYAALKEPAGGVG